MMMRRAALSICDVRQHLNSFVGCGGIFCSAWRFRSTYKLHHETQRVLLKMMFQEHYSKLADAAEPASADGAVQEQQQRALAYEARMEITWICQWVNSLDKPSQDEFEHAVQAAVVARVQQHKPLSYILGTQPFLGCEIRCVPPLLIPRTETEEWVQWFVSRHMQGAETAPLRVMDLCCGTGCIGAALLRRFPNVEVVGVDVDPVAVETTLRNYADAVAANAKAAESSLPSETQERQQPNSAPRRFTALQSDMFLHLPAELHGSFDCILANAPYILPEEFEHELPRAVKDWETRLALVGDERHEGKGLLYFKELRDESLQWLAPAQLPEYKGPRLMFELGLQARVIRRLFAENAAWKPVLLHSDRFEQPRWVEAFFSK